jgi:hypothetical protein
VEINSAAQQVIADALAAGKTREEAADILLRYLALVEVDRVASKFTPPKGMDAVLKQQAKDEKKLGI